MAQWYGSALLIAINKEWDWNSDDIRITLHTSSYTPSLTGHDYVDDLTNEVANGNGYTTGGAALGSRTQTYTAANSWATQWAGSTAFALNYLVRPTSGNGYVYMCSTAGTSSSSQPTWPTVVGRTVADGTAVWTCVGTGVVVLDAADPSWSSATITARYAVISSRTPVGAASQPLLGLCDFGGNVTSTNSTFSVALGSQGTLIMAV